VNQRHKNYFIFFTKVFGWSLSLTLLYFAGNYWGDYEEKSKVKNIKGVQRFPQNSAFPHIFLISIQSGRFVLFDILFFNKNLKTEKIWIKL